MNLRFGDLVLFPAIEKLDLLSANVKEAVTALAFGDKIGVAHIDPELSDTAAFCDHYKISMEQAANCVVLKTKEAQPRFSVCVILSNTRADVNGLARKILNAKASFAPMEEAVAQTNMEYGAITPIGLPSDWVILIDKAVVDSERVVIGSGLRKSKIVIPGNLLALVPNAKVLENLGKLKTQ